MSDDKPRKDERGLPVADAPSWVKEDSDPKPKPKPVRDMRLGISLLALLMSGCDFASVAPAASCSGSSVLAVIDSVTSGAPSPTIVDAAQCWLELRSKQSRPESASVRGLDQALQAGVGIADALVRADADDPGVCRQ